MHAACGHAWNIPSPSELILGVSKASYDHAPCMHLAIMVMNLILLYMTTNQTKGETLHCVLLAYGLAVYHNNLAN
jgi:hypothetical protein